MLQVPLKKTDPISYGPSLKKYISSSYNQDASAFEIDCSEIDQYRLQATTNPTVENLARYYAQIQYLSAKFPISEKGVKISFAWQHSFSPKRKYVSYSIALEKTCILFNLGALLTQRAGQQNFSSAEGIKFACNFYQQAAGVFQYLSDFVKATFAEVASNDHAPHTLKSLELLMLAQAQECFVLKAKTDNKPDTLVARLASQAADLFDQAYDAAVSIPDPNNNAFFERIDWLIHIQVKALYFNALSQFKFAFVAQAASKYGEEIARLDASKSFLTKGLQISQKNPEFQKDLKDLLDQVSARLVSANKDNDKIYMELIPAFKTLATIPRALMVKSNPLPEMSDTKIIGRPLFDKLMPLAVHKCANEYRVKKDEYVQQHLYKLDEASNNLKITLGQLNLPSSLDAFEQPKGLPDSILAQSEEIRNEGGGKSLVSSLEGLQQMNRQLIQTINEALAILKEELEEDDAIRAQFQTRWVRTPSKVLTENLIQEGEGHLAMFKKSSQADTIVKGKIEAFLPAIEQLCGNKADLEAAIPSSTAQSVQGNPQVTALRQLLQTVAQIQKENADLSAEIKNFGQKDDIVPKLLELYGTSPISDPTDAFDQQLATYAPLVEKISQQQAKMSSIIEQVKAANEKFVAVKNSNDIMKKRELVLKQLHDGYLAYKEIKENIKEGMKFYTEMEGVAKHYKEKCSDFRFARRMEMRELMAEIQSTVTGGNQPRNPPSNPSPGGYNPPPPQSGYYNASAPAFSSYNPYYPYR